MLFPLKLSSVYGGTCTDLSQGKNMPVSYNRERIIFQRETGVQDLFKTYTVQIAKLATVCEIFQPGILF